MTLQLVLLFKRSGAGCSLYSFATIIRERMNTSDPIKFFEFDGNVNQSVTLGARPSTRRHQLCTGGFPRPPNVLHSEKSEGTSISSSPSA